jgi:hypothetical protein
LRDRHRHFDVVAENVAKQAPKHAVVATGPAGGDHQLGRRNFFDLHHARFGGGIPGFPGQAYDGIEQTEPIRTLTKLEMKPCLLRESLK